MGRWYRAPIEERHPGPGPDAADPDHLAGDVDKPVLVGEMTPPVGSEAVAGVLTEEAADQPTE